ncbi:MAG TPA: PH domain-containing protein [Candidatus Limnocylindrales bacterium]|nr:PH domain-containing protein [Candidatus Limnocylindrales bacterium]
MNELTIRPTMKFIKLGASLAALVFLALEVLYLVEWRDTMPAWVMAFPVLILFWPLTRYMRRQYMTVVVTADRLRYETGVTSKVTRNIQLAKLQDVRVEQNMKQRMFGVGNLSLETAGEASRLTIPNVDNPQGLADEIMNRSQRGAVS